MKQTYLFYDLETSGLNPCFDQVMQFAAIRTDLQFNEIERHEFFVQLNPDVIASPIALSIHQVSLDDIKDGDNECVAIKKIHAMLNKPGTISVGYNTLGFDDEFLRFSFYRNLLPSYTHQYANKCSRMDIYPITVLYYLFANDSLQWPERNGRRSLKLEDINGANNLATGQAHNALVDVEVTIALAKKLAEKQDMWQYVLGYFEKQTDLTRINQLPVAFSNIQPFHEAIAVQGSLGYRNNFCAPVLHIGQHKHYKNQSLWLRLDNEDLSTLTHDTIADKTFVIKKRAAEPPIILPTKARYLTQINQERLDLAERNKQFLHDNPETLQAIQQHHQHFTFDKVDGADIDSELYQIDFPSRADTQLCQRIHRSPPAKWSQLAEQFEQPIYQRIVDRLLARHYPEHCSAEQKQQFDQYLSDIADADKQRKDFRGQLQLSLSKAKQQLAELLQKPDLSQHQRDLLDAYQQYLIGYTVSQPIS
ncbi:MAG: exonuclease domain-containing protein [Coxiellaceae bacterium]|nr:exonuclease domain-containing protein [Coxiellaceae bacterium]